MSAIDTVYEYAGFKLAALLHDLFSGVGLPLLLALGGLAAAVHAMASERSSLRDLGVHVLYLILAAWLLAPAKSGDLRAPRLAVWTDRAADVLQRRAVSAIQDRFLDSPFEWERIAAMASFGRILDADLGRDVDRFLESCAKPALARGAPRAANLLRPGALVHGDACERRRETIWQRLRRHVETDAFHRSLLQAVRDRQAGESAAFEERYLDEVALRAVDEGGSPTSEARLVRASLGEYSYFDRAQWTGEVPLSVTWGNPVLRFLGDDVANVVVSGAAALQQTWDNRFTAKQQYYLATIYGPHVYGLALLVLIGLFPVAGMWALLPGQWRALVNWGKVFLSVKLWPVLWAALSTFNARRSALEALAPEARGGTDVFLAVASMYLLAPAIAFLVVHLATAAAMMPFAPAVPSASGPGLGPLGPVVNVAIKAAK